MFAESLGSLLRFLSRWRVGTGEVNYTNRYLIRFLAWEIKLSSVPDLMTTETKIVFLS
jgi:hypothetical protein